MLFAKRNLKSKKVSHLRHFYASTSYIFPFGYKSAAISLFPLAMRVLFMLMHARLKQCMVSNKDLELRPEHYPSNGPRKAAPMLFPVVLYDNKYVHMKLKSLEFGMLVL